jgi:hypothetical protein
LRLCCCVGQVNYLRADYKSALSGPSTQAFT